jgi:hypothetical protein
MKQLLLLLLFIPSLLSAQKSKENCCPFSSLSSDSLVLYDFNKNTRPGASIVIEKEGKKVLAPFEKSKKIGIKYSVEFNGWVEDQKSYGAGTAACFDPHLGVVYYKDGQIQAYINICMGCNILESSLPLKVQNQGPQKDEESGAIYYTLNGMSKSFRKYLNQLIRKNNFSHEGKSKPPF